MAPKNNNLIHNAVSEAHDNDIIVDSRAIFLHGYSEEEQDSIILEGCRVEQRGSKKIEALADSISPLNSM